MQEVGYPCMCSPAAGFLMPTCKAKPNPKMGQKLCQRGEASPGWDAELLHLMLLHQRVFFHHALLCGGARAENGLGERAQRWGYLICQ